MIYIYKITNAINNKIYIGKTVNIEQRWKKHQYLARSGEQKHLYEAMRKYGIENFSIEEIDSCDDDLADERERYWISQYKSYDRNIGYNKSFGGEGGDTWSLNTHKEETSAKLSAVLKGHNVPESGRQKIAASKIGKPLPQETKDKISQTLKEKYANGELVSKINENRIQRSGWHHTEASKIKMSESKKGKSFEELFGEHADRLREMHRERWSGEGNPNYKSISIDEMIELFKQGLNNSEICSILNISDGTLYHYTHKYYDTTPNKLREQLGIPTTKLRSAV